MSKPVLGFSKKSLIERGLIGEDDLAGLRLWLLEENMPDFTDEQLARFSLSCDNESDNTKKTIEAYCRARNDAPELFDGWYHEEFIKKMKGDFHIAGIAPKRMDDGCVVVFGRLGNVPYKQFTIAEFAKVGLLTLECALYDSPPSGLVLLVDMQHIYLMLLTKLKISVVQKFFFYLQEGIPVKLKAIHVMNSPYYMNRFMDVLKPFMNKKLYDLVHLHPSYDDYGDFHRKFVPKEYLIEEYGGSLPKLEILNGDLCDKLLALKDYFVAEEKQRKNVNY